jgi:hypothetical protein
MFLTVRSSPPKTKCFLFDQVVSEKKVLTYKDTDNNEKQVVCSAYLYYIYKRRLSGWVFIYEKTYT